MADQIIDRGRGPEIEGTRVTVYRIMDFLREGATRERIALELELTLDQVNAAFDYIQSHSQELEQVYAQLLKRAEQGNPPWIEATLAATPEELRARLRAGKQPEAAHAHSAGQ